MATDLYSSFNSWLAIAFYDFIYSAFFVFDSAVSLVFMNHSNAN